jgi:crescentin
MRRVSHFLLARKGVASKFEGSEVLAFDSQTPKGIEGDGKPTFAEIGARVGEDNEALRNLLIDTGRQFSALDDLKKTFSKLVEPISQTLRTLEHEKSDNVGLRGMLAEIRTNHETLHTEFHALGKKSADLESNNERLHRELALVQQTARALESNKAELTGEIAAARAEIAKLENQLGQETACGRALSDENRILLDHVNSADKRITELEADAALAQENLLLLDDEKSSLRTAFDQTLGENSRLSRRLTESENALTAARARIEQMEKKLAATEEDRDKLFAACDESNERRQSEGYALNLKLEAMRSRAATAEKLMAEVRQGLVGRTEQFRASERKVVETTVARNTLEKQVERLAATCEAQDRQIKELEQSRATLTECSNNLSETLKERETSLARAGDKIESLTDRVDQLEFDAAASRAKTAERIEDLNATVQRERMERAVVEGALETTRRDNARLQREILAERAVQRRSPEEVSDAAKSEEPPKSKNGKGVGRGVKAVEAKPEDAAIEPIATR